MNEISDRTDKKYLEKLKNSKDDDFLFGDSPNIIDDDGVKKIKYVSYFDKPKPLNFEKGKIHF